MHGMGFCCCPPAGCDYFSDDFNRADSSDLGSDWTETAGDWSIASNLLAVSTASAVVTCNTTHPTSGTAYRVSVAMCGGQEGDALRAWINNDPTTFGEVTFHTDGATGRARLRLFVAGTLVGETDIWAPPGEWCYVYLCTDGDHVALGVGGTLYLSAPMTITSSVCGLGTGALNGAMPAKFDNFRLTKHYSDDATCPACGESCTFFYEYPLGDPTNQTPAMSPASWTFVGSWNWLSTADAGAKATIFIENPSGLPRYAMVSLSIYSLGFDPDRIQHARIFADDGEVYAEFICYDVINYGFFWGYKIRMDLYIGGILRGSLDTAESSGGSAPILWSIWRIMISVGSAETIIAVVQDLSRYWQTPNRALCVRATHAPASSATGLETAPGYSGDSTASWSRILLQKHTDTDPACTIPTCPGGLTCDKCTVTPTAWDVAIAGVTSDATCTAVDPALCLKFNDTFRLDQDPADPCRWVYTSGCDASGCDPCQVVLTIEAYSETYVKIRVKALGYPPGTEAKKIEWLYYCPKNCAGVSGLGLILQSTTICAGTPSCSVTAIP